MNPVTSENRLGSCVYFEDGPTGFIAAESVSKEPAVYAYMPLRNLPHLKLCEAMQEQGQAKVSVRLESGSVAMVVTELTARSIALTSKL